MFESAYKYELLGEISISAMSYNTEEQLMKLTSSVEKLFYQSVLNKDAESIIEMAPAITAGMSAFNLRIISGDSVVQSFPVIVKDLIEYRIYPDGRVDLTFTYDKVSTDYRSREVPDVPAIMTDIFTYSGFVALFFAGAKDVAQDTAYKYRTFRHGDIVYHAYDCVSLSGKVSSDGEDCTMFVAVLASRTELPSERGGSRFKDAFNSYVKSRYNAEIINS